MEVMAVEAFQKRPNDGPGFICPNVEGVKWRGKAVSKKADDGTYLFNGLS